VFFHYRLLLNGPADFVLFNYFPFFFDSAVGHDAFFLHSTADAFVPSTTRARAPVRAADLAFFAVRAGKFLSSFDRATEKAFAALAGHRVEVIASCFVAANAT